MPCIGCIHSCLVGGSMQLGPQSRLTSAALLNSGRQHLRNHASKSLSWHEAVACFWVGHGGLLISVLTDMQCGLLTSYSHDPTGERTDDLFVRCMLTDCLGSVKSL